MNETRFLEGKLHVYSNYLAQVLLINFYFVIGTLIGLVFFGIGPSMYAALKLIKEILDDSHESSLFTRFMQYYRQNFFKANKIWFSYVFIFTVLWINIYYYDYHLADSFFKISILIVNYILVFITLLSCTTYMGIDIRLDYDLKNKIKASVLIPIYYFIDTIMFAGLALGIFFTLVLFSQFFAFLFAAVFCYINHYYVGRMTTKFTELIEKKSNQVVMT